MMFYLSLSILTALSFGLWLGWFLKSRQAPKAHEQWWMNLFKTNRDFDGSLLLFGMISLCHITIFSLVGLEVLNFFKPKQEMVIFTPEINHTLLTITISALAGFGGYFFGKASERQKQELGVK